MSTTIWVSEETKRFLSSLKDSVKKVTGKKITYDEAVRVLIDWFFACDGKQKSDECNSKEKLKDELFEKASFLCTLLKCERPNRENVEKHFFFVPKEELNRITELSLNLKVPPAVVFCEVLRKGLEAYEKLTFSIPAEDTRKFLLWWGRLPKQERERVIEMLDKKITACFKGEFLKLKKKLKAG